jgi:hypothetical protein
MYERFLARYPDSPAPWERWRSIATRMLRKGAAALTRLEGRLQ